MPQGYHGRKGIHPRLPDRRVKRVRGVLGVDPYIHACLIGDSLVVRLKGVLTAAEQQLVGSLPAWNGRDLLKQVRTQFIETARPVLEAMVAEVAGVKPVSLHHDISTTTGEQVVVFTLSRTPQFRNKGQK